MQCAICMWLPVEDRTYVEAAAVTIVAGYAVCQPHALDAPENLEAYKYRATVLLERLSR